MVLAASSVQAGPERQGGQVAGSQSPLEAQRSEKLLLLRSVHQATDAFKVREIEVAADGDRARTPSQGPSAVASSVTHIDVCVVLQEAEAPGSDCAGHRRRCSSTSICHLEAWAPGSVMEMVTLVPHAVGHRLQTGQTQRVCCCRPQLYQQPGIPREYEGIQAPSLAV